MTEPKCCPLELLLSQSGQWTLYILWILCTNGALRFGELRRKVDGISTKVLTERRRLLDIHRNRSSPLRTNDSTASNLRTDRSRKGTV
ncbi:winged helix-turn-helix transcriptional regulator [Leptolyngbya sp. FACHB-36]|uniref:winged helix-turn-helix transcriptional regulator n=1 Tax=Leptolyngbya sp. FACHB-36 TaxID=2692808 RepID=UPI001F54869A|nr:winged helix-turn-helix transcriptional regulator [Leptolyngbya sp. FACHB-36]